MTVKPVQLLCFPFTSARSLLVQRRGGPGPLTQRSPSQMGFQADLKRVNTVTRPPREGVVPHVLAVGPLPETKRVPGRAGGGGGRPLAVRAGSPPGQLSVNQTQMWTCSQMLWNTSWLRASTEPPDRPRGSSPRGRALSSAGEEPPLQWMLVTAAPRSGRGQPAAPPSQAEGAPGESPSPTFTPPPPTPAPSPDAPSMARPLPSDSLG
ncbi:unnamed protein product [Gadus morhua 'NCC']